MSCYMINSQTLADIAESIAHICNYPNTQINMYLPCDELQRTFCDCRSPFPYPEYWAEDIYIRLYNLNAEAVRERYGKNTDMVPEWEPEPPAGHILHNDVFAFVKALDSYIYQCSEGKAKLSKDYKAVKSLDNALYRYIVQSDSRYKAAEWPG